MVPGGPLRSFVSIKVRRRGPFLRNGDLLTRLPVPQPKLRKALPVNPRRYGDLTGNGTPQLLLVSDEVVFSRSIDAIRRARLGQACGNVSFVEKPQYYKCFVG
jgi:hypothetical protein